VSANAQLTCIKAESEAEVQDGVMNTPTRLYRDRLLQEQAQLLERIAFERGGVTSQAAVAAKKDVNDFDTHAQVITERDIEFAMSAHETAELNELANALQRLDAGQYGFCTDCEVAIPVARLDAYPAALRCLTCQRAFETAR
jgi:DnaK suppressor protein